jgi:hypothetical protein
MGVLVYVACPESERTTRAVELLRRTGARETATLEKEAEKSLSVVDLAFQPFWRTSDRPFIARRLQEA